MTSPEFGDTTLRRARRGNLSWLDTYSEVLAATSMGPVSQRVVLNDSRFIADNAVLVAGDASWGPTRTRTGAVVGAVQSGKTASMIGVLARALDRGVNVAVVLAGTRTALWQQTLRRVRGQLGIDSGHAPRRIFLPAIFDSDGRVRPAEAYVATKPSVERALRGGQPILVVVLKQVDHLSRVGQTLHRVIFPAAMAAGLPVNMLVIDDEADDSSIEGDANPAPDADVKQVPRRILDLWEHRSRPGQTAAEHVYATYLAYTATPQANFLQDEENPLFPRDFGAVLRTPGPEGDPDDRSLTYRVPEGLRGWYTGADLYYHALRESLCVSLTDTAVGDAADSEPIETTPDADQPADLDAVVDAVRAYLVAAAIRLDRAGERIGPASASATSFESRQAALSSLCSATSMLVHPSAAVDAHFDVARALKDWWGGPDAVGVGADIEQNERAWHRWLDSYRLSARRVAETLERTGPAVDRSIPAWSRLRDLILTEVAPGTTIDVINSDPDADDRPEFEPGPDDAGRWRAPRNLSTIFVAGNVMSRGLTLEGLLTTIFTRTAGIPFADTQMQMQRWFGYRGEYLDLCRLFASDEQLHLFTEYSDTDHVLRVQLLQQMKDAGGPWLDMTVLQGRQYRATGKIANLASRELSPGFNPFFKHVNPPGCDDNNLELLRTLILDAKDRGRLVQHKSGVLIVDPWDLRTIAEMLEKLRYTHHGSHEDDVRYWRSVAQQAGIPPDDRDMPLYRAPTIARSSDYRSLASPYNVAAYLRFWASCVTRDVRGLVTTDYPPQRWALLDHRTRAARQPSFRVGLRFGRGAEVSAGPLRELAEELDVPVLPMVRSFSDDSLYLTAGWGSRQRTEGGYSGDDMFEFRLLGGQPALVRDGVRAPGSHGLALFQLIDRGDGRGAVALGLSIPAGGPDHTEAVNPRWR